MLRVLLIITLFTIVACSGDAPPTAPAGKVSGVSDEVPNFADLLVTFATASSESDSTEVAVGDSSDSLNFDMELIFVSHLSDSEKAAIQEVATLWEKFFYDAEDYVVSDNKNIPIVFPNGMSLDIDLAKGEIIDDIRIYIMVTDRKINIEGWDHAASGQAGATLFRDGQGAPAIGVVLLDRNEIEAFDNERFIQYLWRSTFQHELGHVMGIGGASGWIDNVEWRGRTNSRPFYHGENAKREFEAMGGKTGGVPLRGVGMLSGSRANWRAPHWETFDEVSNRWDVMRWGFFDAYWLQENDMPNVFRVSLGAFEDIGWRVRYELGMSEKINADRLRFCWSRSRSQEMDFHLCH